MVRTPGYEPCTCWAESAALLERRILQPTLHPVAPVEVLPPSDEPRPSSNSLFRFRFCFWYRTDFLSITDHSFVLEPAKQKTFCLRKTSTKDRVIFFHKKNNWNGNRVPFSFLQGSIRFPSANAIYGTIASLFLSNGGGGELWKKCNLILISFFGGFSFFSRRRQRGRPVPGLPRPGRLSPLHGTQFQRLQVPSFTYFYLVLPSFTEFYRVLPIFT